MYKHTPHVSLQDWPGRTKLWHIGVPPSGPMDSAAFRLANALVGNNEGAAGLEITLSGKQHAQQADLLKRHSMHSIHSMLIIFIMCGALHASPI